MALSTLLLPVFAQIGLTFGLAIWMEIVRYSAVQNRLVRPKDILLRQPVWPDKVTQISNSYQNQFEIPVLFYALISLVAITGKANEFFVFLSWLFVLTRFAHAYIHTGSNNLQWRFMCFTAGVITLFVMWIGFAFFTLTGS